MLDAQIASPSSVVASQLDAFMSDDPREAKLCAALRELVARQSFDANGRLKGPRLDISAVARQAKLSRSLVSHEGCELSGARELILDVLRLLSEYSLQVQCDYLIEEVKRLRARLDRQDSILANRVVAFHKAKTKVEPTPKNRYSAADVRNSVVIVPMDEL